MADLRIAFVGAGGMAQRHLKTLTGLFGEKPVAAVCDTDRAKASAACATYGGAAYEDAALMLKAEPIDVVFICTPPLAREEPIKLCCRKNIPFFCEKPPAADLKTAGKIAEAVAKSGVIHSVGFMYRHAETVDEFKRWFDGQTVTSAVSQMACGLLFEPDLLGWRKLAEQGGGPLLDQAINMVDIIRLVAGEIAEVHAFGSNQLAPKSETLTVPETVTIAYRLANGAVGCHYHSWTQKGWTCQLELRTADSRATLDLAAGKASGNIKGETKEAVSQKDYYVTEVERFLQAVREKNPALVRSTYADAAKSLAVVLAANRSLETGKPERVKEV
ncbi:MAG: Gfo/Idh/MocA family oxidoreductase [Verrucomicrobia bacterium]|nr:Gfo/Idh/MocA family oxidoreductase [Verrucomicrobiota bacterium]